jgi:PilZ domain
MTGNPQPLPTPRHGRRFPRYNLDVKMGVSVFRTGSIFSLWGRSTELGMDGIGATLTGDLESGEVVSLEFPLPLSANPLKMRAIVRYRQGLHYGFEFLTLSPEQRTLLERVCGILAASGEGSQ